MSDLALRLIIGILSTWRISAILYYEDGPFSILKKARRYIQVRAMPTYRTGELNKEPWFQRHLLWELVQGQLGCFWCASFWCSLPIALLAMSDIWVVLIPFALSGGAVLLSGGGRVIWRSLGE